MPHITIPIRATTAAWYSTAAETAGVPVTALYETALEQFTRRPSGFTLMKFQDDESVAIDISDALAERLINAAPATGVPGIDGAAERGLQSFFNSNRNAIAETLRHLVASSTTPDTPDTAPSEPPARPRDAAIVTVSTRAASRKLRL